VARTHVTPCDRSMVTWEKRTPIPARDATQSTFLLPPLLYRYHLSRSPRDRCFLPHYVTAAHLNRKNRSLSSAKLATTGEVQRSPPQVIAGSRKCTYRAGLRCCTRGLHIGHQQPKTSENERKLMNSHSEMCIQHTRQHVVCSTCLITGRIFTTFLQRTTDKGLGG